MRERTILVNSLSKTYSVTGWRVGWVMAPPDLTGSIRKVHDFLTVGAAAPLQQAGAVALGFEEKYYRDLAASYQRRRDLLLDTLRGAGFACASPQGAYYIMADISGLGFEDDLKCVSHMVETLGVAAVPGSSFYARRGGGRQEVRFCFAKEYETLERARHSLKGLQLS